MGLRHPVQALCNEWLPNTWMQMGAICHTRGCIQIRHGAHVDEFECVMRHTRMSHGTNMSEPCATYECAMPHICMTFRSECHSISLRSRVENVHTFLTTCLYMCMHEICAHFSVATMESIAFKVAFTVAFRVAFTVKMSRWYRVAFWVRNMQHINTPHDMNATGCNRCRPSGPCTYECASHTMHDTTKLYVIVVLRRAHLLVFPSLVTSSQHVAHTNDTHISSTVNNTHCNRGSSVRLLQVSLCSPLLSISHIKNYTHIRVTTELHSLQQ